MDIRTKFSSIKDKFAGKYDLYMKWYGDIWGHVVLEILRLNKHSCSIQELLFQLGGVGGCGEVVLMNLYRDNIINMDGETVFTDGDMKLFINEVESNPILEKQKKEKKNEKTKT